ncbi:histone-lysine N-methyltransferase ATXR4 isoform X2 [Ziziphus jujuba]|uniref:Histone-lysine N-methyltransferase ATXR4 isoform X2 n=1 Tax=Ziziphus jujuba TaxID=326968 RepID=A0ABM3I4Y1_ZIZJJ|nr:histone-lysine N-methyltransferase ATXR4 isoform X2 [Ziziphus jujuba]
MSKFGLVRCSRWVWRFKTLHPQKKASTFFTTTTEGGQAVNENVSRRPEPPPIRVALTESAGRGVFATRRIGAGELIHRAKPLVSHPSLSKLQNVCYFCLRKLGNSVDSQSQGASFCSEECRKQSKVFHDVEVKADWLAYDEYCRSHGLKYPLLVKRLACMVISGAASADLLDILQPAILSPEMISKKEHQSPAVLLLHGTMEEGFGLLRSAFTMANIPDAHMEFMSRIRINAFRIEVAGGLYGDLLSSAAASVDAEAAVGTAVYMLPSFYNHDCDPNAHIVWTENVDARLKALRDVDAGEELRICYIDASMNHDARQTLLYQGFGFQCNCPRCLSGD